MAVEKRLPLVDCPRAADALRGSRADSGAFQGILGVSSVISPDGSTLAMAVTTKTGPRLFLRALGSAVLSPVAGSEGAANPFWSPDSHSLGFFAAGKMKRVGVDGGAPQTICDATIGPWITATWGANDTILLTGAERPSLYRVGANGGTPVAVLEPEGATSYFWPSFLPDGRHFLFYALHINKQPEVRVGSLDSSESKVVLQGYSRAMHADPGYVLFVREGTLMAQPFDLSTLSVTGSPMPVAEDLLYLRDLGQADFSVSTNGVLAYQAGNTQSRLVWFRRNGSEETDIGEPGEYGFTGLSADEHWWRPMSWTGEPGPQTSRCSILPAVESRRASPSIRQSTGRPSSLPTASNLPLHRRAVAHRTYT